MNKQPIITAQTRQNLIDAFWELYSMKRIEKITVKEITMKAGYNRGTFYEYFEDVYDVLEQIEANLIEKLQQLTPYDLPPGSTFPVESLVQMYEENGKYLAVLFGDHGDPSFQGKVKNSFKLLVKNNLAVLGIQDDIQLELILEYALSAMIGVTGYWFRQEPKLPMEQLMQLLLELSGAGVMKKLAELGLQQD